MTSQRHDTSDSTDISDAEAAMTAVARALFDAFNRRDLQAALALTHPDVVFTPILVKLTRGGEPYRGHDGLREYLGDLVRHWDELTVHPSHLRAAGHAVVALGITRGRGPGGALDTHSSCVMKFRDGVVDSIQVFGDADLARHALGLD